MSGFHEQYDYNVVKGLIQDILDGKHKRPAYECDVPLADSLLQMCKTIGDTCYGAGMRAVQQPIIRALDLKHLLGLH